jgi:hypothetical protein
VRVAALALLLLPASALAMYKCVDERGVTSYSDKPCPAGKGGEVNIQGQPPISGQLQPRDENLSGQDAAFNRRQIERDRETAKGRAAAQTRCAALRRELGGLTTARRVITKVDVSGERTYMDDQTRDKRVADIRDQLRNCP